MKIYTKLGDSGESSIKGARISKGDMIFEILGEIDYLSSSIGILLASLDRRSYCDIAFYLRYTQEILMTISSYIAGYEANIDFLEQQVKELESNIDLLDSNNIELKNFILAGGSRISAETHMLRAITRKVERLLVRFKEEENFVIKGGLLAYINRLSDYFFVLARYFNNNGRNDIIWDISQINKR